MPALIVSLALTLTRGAWIGAAAGTGVLFLIKDFRLTALIPVVIAAALLVAPDELSNRVYSIGDMNDPTTRDRVAMLEAGVGDGPRSSLDRRRPRHGRPRLSGLPHRLRGAGQQSPPPQRADADCGRAWVAGAGAVGLLRDHGWRRPVADAAHATA